MTYEELLAKNFRLRARVRKLGQATIASAHVATHAASL